MGAKLILLSAFLVTFCLPEVQSNADYAMYVWKTGFDHTVQGCDLSKFLNWDTSDPICFTHTWNTPSRRKWLWDTCNSAGREVTRIFLSDVHQMLETAFLLQKCDEKDAKLVKYTLTEGHLKVPQLKIYALFAVGDMAVSEVSMVTEVVWYNDYCANSNDERFDGVALNNEHFENIKYDSVAVQITYLNNLDAFVTTASTQVTGSLFTHYSIPWSWGVVNGTSVSFNNKENTAVRHMIDIFDSTDVQVASTSFPEITNRMITAGYDHAVSLGKLIFTTFYTYKVSYCTSSFFPKTCFNGHIGSEADMFTVMDNFNLKGIPSAQPCISYFRGAYSTGVDPLWKSHKI